MLKDRIRQERGRLGWSQVDLARHAGLTQGHISQIESGKRANPQSDVVAAIAQALGVGVDALQAVPDPIARLRSEGTPDRLLRELLRTWDTLTPDDQERAVVLTRSLAEQTKARQKSHAHGINKEINPTLGMA